jgi:hypothetical protein
MLSHAWKRKRRGTGPAFVTEAILRTGGAPRRAGIIPYSLTGIPLHALTVGRFQPAGASTGSVIITTKSSAP